MTTIVTSQHSGTGQHRYHQIMQILGVPMMVPSSAATPTTRPFQQPNHIELSMNMFPTSAPSMVPFITGAYGFRLANMNQYQIPQNFPQPFHTFENRETRHPRSIEAHPSRWKHSRLFNRIRCSLRVNRRRTVKPIAFLPEYSPPMSIA